MGGARQKTINTSRYSTCSLRYCRLEHMQKPRYIIVSHSHTLYHCIERLVQTEFGGRV